MSWWSALLGSVPWVSPFNPPSHRWTPFVSCYSTYIISFQLACTCSTVQVVARAMSTVASIKLLVKEITSISNTLADTVPKATQDDKIWSVMHSNKRDTVFETFNCRFDILFAEDCRNSDGRLHHVCQGKHGMGLIVSYLSKIDWTGSPLDLVEIKLQWLLTELKCMQYVLLSLSVIHTECYLGEWMLPLDPQADLYALWTLLQSSRMRTMFPHLNFHSSPKPWRTSILAQENFLSLSPLTNPCRQCNQHPQCLCPIPSRVPIHWPNWLVPGQLHESIALSSVTMIKMRILMIVLYNVRHPTLFLSNLTANMLSYHCSHEEAQNVEGQGQAVCGKSIYQWWHRGWCRVGEHWW